MDIDFSEFHTLLPECVHPDIDFSADDLDLIHLCLNLRNHTLSEYLSLPDLKTAQQRNIICEMDHISALIDQIENAMPDQEFSWHRGPISYDD